MIEYSDYLILSDKTNNHFKGDYTSYCNFKKVLELADNISRKQIDTYLYENNHYKLNITLTELNKALDEVLTKKYGGKSKLLRKLATQVGLNKV
tara:strand:- start:1160 stop:1441 length:282 start_codon:yes stop_codon:yes gene_type:complete